MENGIAKSLTHDQLNGKVNGIFSNLFEIDSGALKPEANLYSDLGLDSIDAIDLVISFEKEFRIKPETSEVQQIRTLSDVYDLVHRYYDRTKNNQ